MLNYLSLYLHRRKHLREIDRLNFKRKTIERWDLNDDEKRPLLARIDRKIRETLTAFIDS